MWEDLIVALLRCLSAEHFRALFPSRVGNGKRTLRHMNPLWSTMCRTQGNAGLIPLFHHQQWNGWRTAGHSAQHS